MDKFVIEGGRKLEGDVRVSGSKNSCLPVMAACLLTQGKSYIRNVPALRDVRTMAAVMENLGAVIRFDGSEVVIDTSGTIGHEAPYDLVRTMRASYYVLGPLVAVCGKARVSLPGGCSIGARPVDLHLEGLRHLGAQIDIVHGYIEANAKRLRGTTMDLTGSKGSSVGATINTMMAASLASGETVIEGAAMEPEVVDVADCINTMGGIIEGAGTQRIRIIGQDSLKPARYSVIPDRIEAGTFAVAAALAGGRVNVNDCVPDHMISTIETLHKIGVSIEVSPTAFTVEGDGPECYKPFSIEASQYPGFPTDMQAQFMALATLIPGESIIKESIFENRFLHAVELARMGADISLKGSLARIRGVGSLTGAPVMASDLRASAALVLAGLAARGETRVYRIYHLDRGYESLEKKLGGLGARCLRISEG